MTPKSVKDFFEEWLQHNEACKDRVESARNRLLEWMREDGFDFSYFKLKPDVHTFRKPVAIYGMAHDWIATYPDSEWEAHKILDVRFDFDDVNNGDLHLEIIYDNGDANYADVPLEALSDFNKFAGWYNEQLANYKENKANLAKYIKERDEAAKTDGFKKWLAEGDKYIQLGMVKVTIYGEEVRGK